jgi:putative ABC transport system ATP-binding protein
MIEMRNIHKAFTLGGQVFEVLKGIDFSVEAGELVSIMGASGSGKSTLMNLIGMLDQPTAGEYWLAGNNVAEISSDELASIRNRTIGFVFQQFFLLPRLTALQNVALPMQYAHIPHAGIEQHCLDMLAKVGMRDYAQQKPSQLSGGQQQRVAIARALVMDPKVVLADEPTGALDSKIGQEVMDLFLKLNREDHVTMIIITHDEKIAEQCARTVHVRDGLVVHD